MKRSLLLLASIILILSGCSGKSVNNNKINIAVSIGPEEAFVNAVLGDKGTVTTVIPPGFSPANYQPSPKELEHISDADLYFTIGVASENNILPKIVSNNTEVISLKDVSEKEYPILYLDSHSHEHDETTENEKEETSKVIDPHIWMSPKRVIVMINSIRDSLCDIDPENKDYYVDNAAKYIAELEKLDIYIEETLKDSDIDNFIIYHPSLGYFANDYGLKMMVIEEDGKTATIETMTNVINSAKEQNIKVVFYQQEFDSKQATVIADEINGKVISLDILSKEYIDNYKKIVDTFVSSY
ncbi:metal ABC transporter solute-binding protein, Zn/Mn family [Vallitalea sp.]|jgi:zinc transport system substrate-binding protein|uniref:metal ABC transporter solute-binding protein, Zn/Mn family n=1 Tax=Vallitalea sp. TaxID=1882829 RepID=UPI0025FF1CC7|nr:zinc ABC transporter substrate-binding protein [Vallitalea sp.]MCT4687581.1 zinc ABC transporter substrate-binding protein [Vallitalea sp.]